MIDNRVLLIGLFNAVGALAKRLTGDTMLVCFCHGEGKIISHCYPDPTRVTWIPAAQAFPDGLLELGAMRCPVHGSLADTPSGPDQVPERTAILAG